MFGGSNLTSELQCSFGGLNTSTSLFGQPQQTNVTNIFINDTEDNTFKTGYSYSSSNTGSGPFNNTPFAATAQQQSIFGSSRAKSIFGADSSTCNNSRNIVGNSAHQPSLFGGNCVSLFGGQSSVDIIPDDGRYTPL